MRRALTAWTLAVMVLVGGCGTGDSGSPVENDPTVELVDPVDGAAEDGGYVPPEACQTQFVGVVTPPDLARVALPTGWPEPPIPATLCKTQTGGSLDEVGYATDAAPEDVLDAYAKALAVYSPERTDGDGYGAGTVTGELDGVGFVIQPRTGSFEIVLDPSGQP